MVGSDEPHVVDLRDDDPDPTVGATEVVRSRRPGLAIAAVVALAVAVVALALGLFEGDPPEEPDTPAAAPTPRPSRSDAGGTGGSAAPATRLVDDAAVPPVEMAVTLTLATRAVDGGVVDFVRVDTATGAATHLDNRSLLGLGEVRDVRFFGPDRAVAQLDDGAYLTVAIGHERVEIVSLVDVTATAAATPLGLDALHADGRIAWVESPYGFFEWDLVEDRIIGRWLDRDGDLERLPRPRLAVDSGLVVEAGGAPYLVEGGTARRLELQGEVVAGADDWVLTRSCDDELDCGDLTLVELASSTTVELRDERFRQRCGLMAPVPPGSIGGEGAVAVVLQRFGSSAVVVVDRDGVVSVTALHPLPVGCLDATVLADGRIVVFSDTTLAFVDGDDVEVVTTFALGRTLAGTAAPS